VRRHVTQRWADQVQTSEGWCQEWQEIELYPIHGGPAPVVLIINLNVTSGSHKGGVAVNHQNVAQVVPELTYIEEAAFWGKIQAESGKVVVLAGNFNVKQESGLSFAALGGWQCYRSSTEMDWISVKLCGSQPLPSPAVGFTAPTPVIPGAPVAAMSDRAAHNPKAGGCALAAAHPCPIHAQGLQQSPLLLRSANLPPRLPEGST
jgi:hypothetical protein